jgi:CheY-like chemotaxis protein
MPQRVFVKVVGFTDVERHALNTVFRLSEQREIVYSLWDAEAPEPPRLALVDGQSYEAALELALPVNEGLKFIWVGEEPPPDASHVFERPMAWPELVHSMDELFIPEAPLDFDLDWDSDRAQTHPPAAGKRALIVAADRDERLYLRAKLALAELTQADEAQTGALALELARAHRYDVALVDFALPDVDGWAFLGELRQARPPIAHIIVTKWRPSAADRLRARFAGAREIFEKPPHPGKLHSLLQKIGSED